MHGVFKTTKFEPGEKISVEEALKRFPNASGLLAIMHARSPYASTTVPRKKKRRECVEENFE